MPSELSILAHKGGGGPWLQVYVGPWAIESQWAPYASTSFINPVYYTLLKAPGTFLLVFFAELFECISFFKITYIYFLVISNKESQKNPSHVKIPQKEEKQLYSEKVCNLILLLPKFYLRRPEQFFCVCLPTFLFLARRAVVLLGPILPYTSDKCNK